MTLEDDVNRLHREWANLKAALWADRWDTGIGLSLIYLGILAIVLLVGLVTLP